MDFFKKHPIVTNLLLIAACGFLLIVAAMFGLDAWTAHGKVQVVPNVHAMTIPEAERVLRGSNLQVEVVDSVYDTAIARGSVVEQVPPAGNRVKPGRTVYLTINAFSPRRITLPDLVGSSLRQARASLESMGFKDIREVRVPSDYRDLVLAIKSMGVTLRAGTKLPLSSTIVIEVGEGYSAAATAAADDEDITMLSEDEWDSIIDNAENEY